VKLKYGKVKFGYKDSWSAEPVLSEIIADWLKNFRNVLWEKRVGCPQQVLDLVYPDHDHFNYTDEQIKQGLVKWFEMIDDMIYAFENIEPVYSGEWVNGEGHGDIDEHGHTRWNKQPSDPDAYRQHRDLCDRHHQRVKKGRQLFTEHYDSLWW